MGTVKKGVVVGRLGWGGGGWGTVQTLSLDPSWQ